MRLGYLANVQCVEIWCPMTPEFFKEYLNHSNPLPRSGSEGSLSSGRVGAGGIRNRTQQLLYILNPRKFRAAEYLVQHHIRRGDKVILFSDDVPALILYCEKLKVPYIYGETPEEERRLNILAFRTHSEFNCIGLSKVGDTALDIPEANVIIQVSSHFGARRQEAQRLGRILRPKPNPTGGFNAFFYTLVSTDTREMYFSAKRQQYLVDQGYTFKIVQDLVDVADKESSLLQSKKMELDLLNKVVSFRNCEQYDKKEEQAVQRENLGLDTQQELDEEDEDEAPAVSRNVGIGFRQMTGAAEGIRYREYSVNANKA